MTMSAERSSWQRLARIALWVGEALAVIATVFALFEVFFARRIAPIHVTEIVSCDAQGSDTALAELDDFLSENSEAFVYFDLDIAWLNRCRGGATAYEEDVLFAVPSGYIEYDRRDFEAAILSRYETAEDFIDERFPGLFYVTNHPGEGENYFKIVPAPFDSGTQRMQVCTQAFTHQAWAQRVSAYIGSCIFS